MEIKNWKLKLKLLVSKTRSFTLDIFFPSFCVTCKKEGSFLCENCKKKIEIFKTPSHLPQKSKLEIFYCATEYRQDEIGKLIYNFKYRFIKEIRKELGEILIEHLEKSGFKKNDNQILIPVPLHKKRLKWRGFNQSEILAKEISSHFDIPVITNTLFREKYTEPQTLKQDRKERIKNIKNAFLCKNTEIIKNKEIILVDDVLTTGSTLKECAKTLSRNGMEKIIAIVIAK